MKLGIFQKFIFLETSLADLLVIVAAPHSTPDVIGSKLHRNPVTLSNIDLIVDPILVRKTVVFNTLLLFLSLFFLVEFLDILFKKSRS